MILAARADFIFYLGVVQEHVAAAAGGDLNFGEGFLDLAGFKGDAHERVSVGKVGCHAPSLQ